LRQKIFIIILNFNGREDTLACLASLEKIKKNKGQAVKIVVVDNASTDGSISAIKKNFPQVKIIANKENLGFSEGNNAGLKSALKEGGDYCLVLNNDTLVKDDFLGELLRVKADIVSPKIYFAPGSEYYQRRYRKGDRGRVIWYAGGQIDWQNVLASHRGVDEVDRGQFDQIEETDFATGCCLLIGREVLEKVGLFDSRYFLYWEDNDLCQRAKRLGFKVCFAPRAVVWHKNAGSSRVGSDLHDYYLTRNRLLFGWQYASWRAKFALVRESVIKLFNGRKWERRGIIDFYLRRFKRGSYRIS